MLRRRGRPPRLPAGLPSARDHPQRHRRLHSNMAKKRVHELAKQYDMPSAEVMKRLNAYGLKVKASASAVDEDEAERALTGKPPRQESNGKPDDQPRQPQQTGMGFDRPATETARQRLEERQQRAQAAAQARQQSQAKAKDTKKDGGKPRTGDGQAPDAKPPGDGQGGGERRQRPTRSSLQGERAPGTTGGVRRVV